MHFSNEFPFLYDYFNSAIKNNTIPNSILFFGKDFNAQYDIALEIARRLNCKTDGSETCECLNCKWIKEGTHPAILTISRKDNKPSDDESKTVISVKQAGLIKYTLSTTSEFHRVFILCDRDNDGKIAPVNQLNFQEEASNSLLKIIEEGKNVTFIFITENKEDVLQTILSRSQAFFVPSKNDYDYNFSIIDGVFTNYRSILRADAFDTAESLLSLSEKHSDLEIINSIQNYILFCLKSNPTDRTYIKDLEITEEAKNQVRLGLNSAGIYENLCLKLIK